MINEYKMNIQGEWLDNKWIEIVYSWKTNGWIMKRKCIFRGDEWMNKMINDQKIYIQGRWIEDKWKENVREFKGQEEYISKPNI